MLILKLLACPEITPYYELLLCSYGEVCDGRYLSTVPVPGPSELGKDLSIAYTHIQPYLLAPSASLYAMYISSNYNQCN